MNSSEGRVPLGGGQSVVRDDDHPEDDFVMWLVTRGQEDHEIVPDAPRTDDERIRKLGRAAARCVAECGLPSGATVQRFAGHIAAAHTTEGELSAGLDQVLSVARRRHSFAPISLDRWLRADGARERVDWGPWTLSAEADPDYPVLKLGQLYYVELNECTTSAEVLDRIAQVRQKSWANDAVVSGLCRALDDVLGLQQNLCGGGASDRLTVERIRKLAAAKLETGR